MVDEPTTNELALRVDEPSELATQEQSRATDALLGFFAPSAVAEAFRKSHWTIEEEIRMLVSIARGDTEHSLGYEEPPSRKDRLTARAELRKLGRESLETDGQIVRTNQHRQITDADGNVVTQHLEGLRMTTLPAMAHTTKLIDEGVLNDEDSAPTTDPSPTEDASTGEPT